MGRFASTSAVILTLVTVGLLLGASTPRALADESRASSSVVTRSPEVIPVSPFRELQSMVTRSAPIRLQWPTNGPITNHMTERHPLGIDIGLAAYRNQPILAAAAGRVVFAGGDPCCSYGLYVEVDHGDGWVTLYSHLSRVDVEEGQEVGAGQPVGLGGNTGRSTSDHLHFELKFMGVRMNPIPHLPRPCVNDKGFYKEYVVLSGDCSDSPFAPDKPEPEPHEHDEECPCGQKDRRPAS